MTANTESRHFSQRHFTQRHGRIAAGALSLLLSAGYVTAAVGMPRGTAAAPGPGLFPLGVGAMGVVISIVVIVESLRATGPDEPIGIARGRQGRQQLLFIAALLALIIALPLLGQYVTACLYCIAVIRFLSDLPWWRVVVTGILTGAVVSWIFINLLAIRLPAGIWWPL